MERVALDINGGIGGSGDDHTLMASVANGGPAVAAPLGPADPRRVGGYTLLGRLGEGGMGTVYLALKLDGEPVALKVIRAEYAQDDRFLNRFRYEVAAARRVARFCTAQVLDAGIDAGTPYIVTEFIDGPTLAAEVSARGPMRRSTLDGLAIGVAAALNGIHTAGVVHRDLKPSNVMLSRIGPKVIDFGIARALDAAAGATTSGQVEGTPAYMAPEQFTPGRSTPASDVFAWGAVVAFAGTGRSPFGEGSPYELMKRVVEDQPDLAGLDRRLRSVVSAAMSKDPRDRPSSRALLLSLVGQTDDPITATTTALDAAWRTRSPAQDVNAGHPLTGAAPEQRRGRRLLAMAAALAIGALAMALLVSSATPGGGSGSSTTVGAQPIRLGERVPPSGFMELESGEIHRFKFDAPAGARLFVEGIAENCAHLLPWRVTAADGSRVAASAFGCAVYGPVTLTRSGNYELRVGGDDLAGTYAFRLSLG
jgi:serine/threonine protein kinase